jgi:hypothetical protein
MPTELERSIAGRLYSNLVKTKPEEKIKPPVDGLARKQRQAWGENVDHITRGPVSPLGGQVKSK